MRGLNSGQAIITLVYSCIINMVLAYDGPAFSMNALLQNDHHYIDTFRRAELDRKNGNFYSAIVRFKEALGVSRDAGDSVEEAVCLIRLGLMYWNVGQVSESINCYKDAQRKARESGQNDILDGCRAAMEAIRLYNIGKNYLQSNLCQRSIESFDGALGISRRIQNEEITVKCLRQMSLTYWQMNDLKKFLLCNEEALESARRIKHNKEEGRCLNNIGLYHWKSTNYSSALDYFNAALQIAQRMNEVQSEAENLNNIGIIYNGMS
jgi:tetratricopeptide (TPR) repeat protein